MLGCFEPGAPTVRAWTVTIREEVNICNISYADIVTCVINVGQSVSDHNGTDGPNRFSAIGPDLSGLPLWSEHAETTTPGGGGHVRLSDSAGAQPSSEYHFIFYRYYSYITRTLQL